MGFQTYTSPCGCRLKQDQNDLDNCIAFNPCAIHPDVKIENAVKVVRDWNKENPNAALPPEHPNCYPFYVDALKGCFINSRNEIKDCLNELRTLETLQNGLFSLYSQVRILEERYYEENFKDGSIPIYFGLNQSSNETPDQMLITNYFHWFANDLVNYCRLAGFTWLKINGQISNEDIVYTGNHHNSKVKLLVDDYISSLNEINSVKRWRDKVSAHFSITDPRKGESSSVRFESLLQQPSFWINGRYTVDVIKIGEASAKNQWSLTEIFENLSPRYWPNEYGFFLKRFNGFQL